MGVSVELWRARIGTFSARGSCSLINHIKINTGGINSLVMTLFLINALLVMGCVEMNPGPDQHKCSYCDQVFSSVTRYGEHQIVHMKGKHFLFPCSVSGCPQRFSTTTGFSIHHSRFHIKTQALHSEATSSSNVFVDVMQSPSDFKCLYCAKLFRTASLLRKHSNDHLTRGSIILCPFQPCHLKFTKVSTFSVHVSQYHKVIASGDQTQQTAPQEQVVHANYDIDVGDDNFDLDSCSISSDHSADSDDEFEDAIGTSEEEALSSSANQENIFPENMVRDHCGLFYLMLEGELLIPALKVQRLSEEISRLLRMSHQRLKTAFIAELRRAGLEEEKIDPLITAALRKDTVFNVHHKGMDVVDLSSAHMRRQFYIRKCVMLEPVVISLGENDQGKKKYAHYIPIDDTLHHVLNDDSIQEQIQASFSRKSTPGVFKDFIDGSVFKDHPICGQMDSIQLIMFQDAFTFYPLSPSAGTYKCVGFYFTLGNLNPACRSKVDTIQLALLVTESDLKFFGAEACLKPLISDLKKLVENGIQFMGRTLPVVPLFMCGDNLGQHSFGGYVEGFTGTYFCRFCEITKQAFREDPTTVLPLRTPEDYDNCIKQLKPNDPEYTVKGIKCECAFHIIPFFHVCRPALPVCLSHDIWEGLAKRDVALYINYFVEKEWITFDTLNRRIENFNCLGRDAADSLVKLKPGLGKISGHASEVWLFVRMLPFLIGDCIQDENDPVWQLFLKFKVMCEYVSAPSITENQVAKLKELTALYLELRASLFSVPLQPKHHYLMHYSELIFYFGNLIRLWAMRFESRHMFFKQAAKAANNFKNITFTLASKYVLNFAYKFSGRLIPPAVSFADKDVIIPDVNALKAEIVHLINAEPSFCLSLTKVVVNGITYSSGLWLILGCNKKDLIVGEIVMILCDRKKVKFIVKRHQAINTFRGYYQIQRSEQENFVGVLLEDVDNYYPLPAYDFQDSLCLSLKHSSPCMN